MSLILFETKLEGQNVTKASFKEKVDGIQSLLNKQQASLIEVQVAKDFSQIFFIVETEEQGSVANTFESEGFPIHLQKEVRLVGDDLERIKSQTETVNYIVEWNLPEHLTMDQYLNRKQQNSVHYAEVPEVSFSRTYVCEDMTKCLCFYDAPDEAAVKRAREAVNAPIDSITELGENK